MQTMSSNKHTFDSRLTRNLTGIGLAFITAVVMIPGMTTYLPFYLADRIAVPILLFPFIWLGLFLYAYLARRAYHAVLLMLALTFIHGTLSYLALTGVM